MLHRYVASLLFVLVCVFTLGGEPANAASPAEKELRIGLVPALSPARFVARFSAMVGYLEKRLDMDVTLVGAPSYAEFIRRAQKGGHYDVLITGADVFRYLETRAGYRGLVRLSGKGNYALIAVKPESGIQTLADLKGRTVSTADPLSLSRRLGEARLAAAGVVLGSDAKVLVTPTQNASMMSMVSGLSDAAIFMSPVLARASAQIAAQVKVLAESERAKSHALSAAPHVSEALFEQLQTLLSVMHEAPDGARFFDEIKWPHFVRVEPGEYVSMDWAADAIEAQLKAIPAQ